MHMYNILLPNCTNMFIFTYVYVQLVKLKSPTLYRFADTLNSAVDHALVQHLRSSRPLLQYSVDHLVNSVSQSCIDMLVASPPEMATTARVFINRPLPRTLRPFIWSNALGLARERIKVVVTRLAPAAEVLMARRCQLILERYFGKIASRANAAFTKTVVAHFLKAHEIPLPAEEGDCVRAPSHFDLLVFLAVPLLAVMKMFGVGGKGGRVAVQQSTTATTSGSMADAVWSLQQGMATLAEEEGKTSGTSPSKHRTVSGHNNSSHTTSTNNNNNSHDNGEDGGGGAEEEEEENNNMSYRSEGDIKLAVVSGVVALTSLVSSVLTALTCSN